MKEIYKEIEESDFDESIHFSKSKFFLELVGDWLSELIHKSGSE